MRCTGGGDSSVTSLHNTQHMMSFEHPRFIPTGDPTYKHLIQYASLHPLTCDPRRQASNMRKARNGGGDRAIECSVIRHRRTPK